MRGKLGYSFAATVFGAVLVCSPVARGQGPAPESAPTLFPGGALFSYSSTFLTRGVPDATTIPVTAKPTFSHEGDVNFTWGFHNNFDLEALVPIVTNRFKIAGPQGNAVGGTGLGDVLVRVKYRFYRRDSARGTSQASFTIGPKLPTGETHLTDASGRVLPASLQPGTGSTDFFAGANWTYTGLFHFERLVADEDFRSVLRTQGTQATRLGDDFESRFWLSYRPYESKNVGREWFIGPELTWLGSQDDRIGGITQQGSGGSALLLGATTFVSVRPGMHLWAGFDWDVVHTNGVAFMPVRRHISFGVTQQFGFHLLRF